MSRRRGELAAFNEQFVSGHQFEISSRDGISHAKKSDFVPPLMQGHMHISRDLGLLASECNVWHFCAFVA